LLQRLAVQNKEPQRARLPIQHELTLALVGRVSRSLILVKGCIGEKRREGEIKQEQVYHEYDRIVRIL